MKTFCTISTVSHLFKTFALADSILQFGYRLQVLVTDGNEIPENCPESVQLFFLESIQVDDFGIQKKYANRKDKLRWALKPVWIKYLLQQEFNQVIYVDNDLFFYSDPTFLFELLNEYDFLLTPHFYSSDPSQNQNWFEANFRVGLFNAGFVGANKRALSPLDWWAKSCAYNVKKAFWRGLFDDQKYLDLIPVLFDNVLILKHKGCNLAGWNYLVFQLERKRNQEVFVAGYPLVFIHFAPLTIHEFSRINHFFEAEWENYRLSLKSYHPTFEIKSPRLESRNLLSFFYYLRWRLTRFIEK